jgi:hypothetical protein
VQRSLFLVVFAIVTACGSSVRYAPRGSTAAAIDPASVAIYTMTPSTLHYDVVGAFHAQASGYQFEPGTALLAHIRDEAARRGCRAVLVDHGYCAEEAGSMLVGTESSLDALCIEVRR